MTQVIAGKSLHDWMNAPAGAFVQAVRKSLDPHYGRETEGMKKFNVRVHAERTEYERTTYDIEEFNKEEAQSAAIAKFEEEHGDSWDDIDAVALEVPA